MTKHRARRLSNRLYIYRGFEIIGFYNDPEHPLCWEAVDEYGCGFVQSYSLEETKKCIDRKLDKEKEV